MSLFNHINLGDLQSYVYLEGVIKAVYLETTGVDEANWDTADVEYENKKLFHNAPVRYHCQKTGIDRASGAIVDGAKGFGEGDKVILMAKIGTEADKGEEYEKMFVIAHRDGTVPCAYNYLFIRIGPKVLGPLVPPYGKWLEGGLYLVTNPNDHPNEYCTVWDTQQGAPANVYNPISGEPYVFPVSIEDFKPAMDYYKFAEEELFTLGPQGDNQSQEAGFTPDWLSDVQGDKIRAGALANSWWTSADIYANPIFSLLAKTSLALFTDSAGAGDGSFAKTMEIFNAAKIGIGDEPSQIAKWKEASPKAFNDDTRSFDVTGSGAQEEMPESTKARLQELQTLIGTLTDLIAALKIEYSIFDTGTIARWKALDEMADRGTLDQAEYEALKKNQTVLKFQKYGAAGASATPLIARWESLTARIKLGETLTPEEQAETVALSADPVIPTYQFYKDRQAIAQAEIDEILAKRVFVAWEIANDTKNKPLKGSSYHMQNAYGENEIWVCAKNTYLGLVVDSCDALWKFVRLTNLPPVIPIGNPAAERLAGRQWLGFGGMALNGVLSMNDISLAIASDITVGDDNNIFSYGTLKRVNDGGFHRTTHPALRSLGIGSFRLTQNKIPYMPKEPTFITAINSRMEHIDVWHRYDNWMNSIQFSAATPGVDRTWWFKSNAEQWRIKANFIDTPIGSMWYAAPEWEAGLWYLSGIITGTGAITARRDFAANTHFTRQTKHTRRVVCQIYIVQRQAVTMFEDPALTFVRQETNKGIYDHLAAADVPAEIQPDVDAWQKVIDEMTALIALLDAEKIARWKLLTSGTGVLHPTLQTELDTLNSDEGIRRYIGLKEALDTAQAAIDAIIHPLEKVKYVGGVDYYTLTPEDKKSKVSDRVYLRTKYPGEVGYNPPAALRSNRNEVEIMAACDLYSSLKTQKADGTQPAAGEEVAGGTCNPANQVRRGLLEYEIQKLIARHYTDQNLGLKDFSAFNLEVRIV